MAVNKELAATALLEALYTTDRQACERHGISERTLRRWRKALASDEELAAFVRTKKRALDAAWAEGLPVALRNSLEFIAGACARARNDPSAYRNPTLISAVAGALKLCAEVFYTGRVIDTRLTQFEGDFVDCSDPKNRGLVH